MLSSPDDSGDVFGKFFSSIKKVDTHVYLREPVKLSRITSAIGNIVISGAESVLVEFSNGSGVGIDKKGQKVFKFADGTLSAVPNKGNREVVYFDSNDLFITCSHIKDIKRAVFSPEAGYDVFTISSTINENISVRCPTGKDSVLYMSVVEGSIVFRNETALKGRSLQSIYSF